MAKPLSIDALGLIDAIHPKFRGIRTLYGDDSDFEILMPIGDIA